MITRQTCQTRHARGMSLVEMMIWIAISLLMLTVISMVYLNAKQVTRVNDTVSRLQENGRFVLYLLDRDLRMASFRACNGPSLTPLNLLNSTSYPYQYDKGIEGYHAVGAGWSPNLDGTISGLTPAPLAGRDVVTIRFVDGPGVPLTSPMANTSATLQVSPGSPLAQGDLLLVADCGSAAILQSTGFNAGTGVISHIAGGASVPGNTAADLGHIFSTDASVFRLVTRTYYVAQSARKPGTNALWVNSVPNYDGVAQPAELVEGIEQLALSFGEDTDGDRAANRYVAADLVGNWSNVVSVKPQVLLATIADRMALTPQPYTFNGVSTTPTDRRLRSVLASVITLRNRVP